jgi:hypothetical protein
MTAGDPVQVAGGAVRVVLPAGQELQEREGVARWSPDPDAGAFTIVSGAAEGGGADVLLAAERADGQVDVEQDEETHRGGLPVRHVRYRSHRHTPRVALDGGDAGPRYAGDEDVAYRNEFLFVVSGERIVRVGYAILEQAPAEVREALEAVLHQVRIGDEP